MVQTVPLWFVNRITTIQISKTLPWPPKKKTKSERERGGGVERWREQISLVMAAGDEQTHFVGHGGRHWAHTHFFKEGGGLGGGEERWRGGIAGEGEGGREAGGLLN